MHKKVVRVRCVFVRVMQRRSGHIVRRGGASATASTALSRGQSAAVCTPFRPQQRRAPVVGRVQRVDEENRRNVNH